MESNEIEVSVFFSLLLPNAAKVAINSLQKSQKCVACQDQNFNCGHIDFIPNAEHCDFHGDLT